MTICPVAVTTEVNRSSFVIDEQLGLSYDNLHEFSCWIPMVDFPPNLSHCVAEQCIADVALSKETIFSTIIEKTSSVFPKAVSALGFCRMGASEGIWLLVTVVPS